MHAQVAIVGAGPAGMFLAHILATSGIDAVVVELHERAHIEARIRAGVLERTTTALLDRLGLSAGMHREGIVHHGVNFAADGEMFRIDFGKAADGASMTVYGQQAVMRDLFDHAAPRGLRIVFGARLVQLHGLDSNTPCVTWTADGERQELDCDFIAGCDGFHGVCRAAIPAHAISIFERAYPFGWLGILADVPPVDAELIYANHEHGFALASMRSATRSRYYLQTPADTVLADWPDERIWDELATRLGPEAEARMIRGPSIEKSIAPLRSFVAEPMRYGRLFLAGDAAHIVPPTGAKGMNLAVSDVVMLAEAFEMVYAGRGNAGIDGYSARALARVWKVARFSWWLTGLTHRFPETSGFDRRMQQAELSYLRRSPAAQTVFAENYLGLPLE